MALTLVSQRRKSLYLTPKFIPDNLFSNKLLKCFKFRYNLFFYRDLTVEIIKEGIEYSDNVGTHHVGHDHIVLYMNSPPILFTTITSKSLVLLDIMIDSS